MAFTETNEYTCLLCPEPTADNTALEHVTPVVQHLRAADDCVCDEPDGFTSEYELAFADDTPAERAYVRRAEWEDQRDRELRLLADWAPPKMRRLPAPARVGDGLNA